MTPENHTGIQSAKPSVGLLIFTILVLIANLFLGYQAGMRETGNVSAALGESTAIVGLAIIVVGIFYLNKRFRNPRSQTVIVLVVSLLGLIQHIGRLPQTADTELARVAKEFNRGCPKMLDSAVRLNGVETTQDRVFVIKLSIINIVKANIDKTMWESNFKKTVVDTASSNGQIKRILNLGFIVRYSYVDKNGELIDNIDITKSQATK